MMPNFSDDDPRWATLRADHQARHGAAIAYIKRQVGPGLEFANEVAHAVLSDAGVYYQLTEMPEEFVGALGADVAHRLISETEALATMARLGALLQDVANGEVPAHAVSLYVLYAGGSLRARRAMYVFDHNQDDPAPFVHGVLVPRSVPRVFKLRLHLDDSTEPYGFPMRGTILFLAPSHTDGGQCLLATIARTVETRDLLLPPTSGRHPRMN